jgi:hypothetical protein
VWPFLSDRGGPREIGRLLLLRCTKASRALASDLPEVFATAYPADPAAIRLALTTADGAWPGNGLLWVGVDGAEARILERRPPGVRGASAGGGYPARAHAEHDDHHDPDRDQHVADAEHVRERQPRRERVEVGQRFEGR